MNLHNPRSFIVAIQPFDRLNEQEMVRVLDALDIQFFPREQVVLKAGDVPEFLYILIKGVVREEDAEGLVAFHGPEDLFDPTALIAGSTHHFFTVIEELLCYTLPRQLFLELARYNRSFQDYFFQNLSQKIAGLQGSRSDHDLNPLMMSRIKDLELRPVQYIQATDSIRNAAALMKTHKTDALLVGFGDQIGIVTGSDIRNALALVELSPRDEVGLIASRVITTIAIDDYLFNALLQMTRHGISRLLVMRGDEREGFLELVDLLSFWSNQSHFILGRIDRASSLEELRTASDKIPFMVQQLHAKGVKIRYVARLVRELNRRIMTKIYTLLTPETVVDNSVLIVMGSEGRGEQLVKTDQDNAMILRDGFVYPEINALRQQLAMAMESLGFPACPGGIMLSNDGWCASWSDFRAMIHNWIQCADSHSLMNLAIFYDAVPVAGDPQLLQQLKKEMLSLLPDDKAFFSHFAKATVTFGTPLSLFSNFIVEKAGAGKNHLDVKKGGIFPIVHAIRSLAIENGLREVNTAKRVRLLSKLGVFDTSFADDIIEAFDFMSGIRFFSILEQGQDSHSITQNNLIDPVQLSRLQRDLLRDSLQTVNRLKKFTSHHFRLDLIG
ncbi:MAG: cyclic nucleotide-binding domain-containing protein [Magnetococcales bacterium]|nr:cyclic nucleotide-binding domain-containing protein [Magnetococcales bacterium]